MAAVARPPSPRIRNPVESLVFGLEKLRIRSPERALPRRRSTRSSADSDLFSEPLAVIKEARELEEQWELNHSSSFPAQVLRAINFERAVPVNDPADILGPCERHNTGRYDWILSTQLKLQTTDEDTLDHASPGDWRYYGCNWLVEREETGIDTDHPGVTAVHTLLATELLGNDSTSMALPDPIVRVISPPASDNVDGEVIDIFVPSSSTTRNVSADTSSSGVSGEHIEYPVPSHFVETAPASSPVSSQSASTPAQARIEDSVEALDRLEEDLEALQSATQVQSFPSPAKKRQPLVVFDRASNVTRGPLQNALSDIKNMPGKSASVRVKPTASRPQLRKSASMDMTDEQASCTMARKSVVTRPSSLLPPKPPAKSTKAPTKPTFELPGEAVARRLKEQREARRSMQIIPDKAAPSVPQRSKSVRAPTIPKFELPGEAISRRKKEQHEKLLREQAEEERKRREFKAAPVRASAAPASYPRETAASRARRVKASGEDVQEAPQPRASTASNTASKRSSVIGVVSRPSLRKSASTISSVSTASTSSQSRGRVSTTDESQTSRGTSTSAASPSSKRVPMSAEEVERLRLRGRELYEQDNSYVGERERERRQREMAAKQAREQAAERSRQASREWAERQRRRQSALIAGQTTR